MYRAYATVMWSLRCNEQQQAQGFAVVALANAMLFTQTWLKKAAGSLQGGRATGTLTDNECANIRTQMQMYTHTHTLRHSALTTEMPAPATTTMRLLLLISAASWSMALLAPELPG